MAEAAALRPDRRVALREGGRPAQEAPWSGRGARLRMRGAFFGQLTERGWALLHALQGKGELAVRELA